LKENSISTVVTTQIDRVHLTPAETEAVYSPKHRTGRCLVLQRSENRPQGHRRLRFFFLLHLSKSTPAPPGADNEDPRTVQPALRRPNPRSPRQMAANPRPPSMKLYLAKPAPNVNNNFEVFCSSDPDPVSLQYSRHASWFAEMSSSLRSLRLR